MKLMKRTNIYKASNVTYNPITKDAFSYAWWRFVAVVEGQLVFNNFRYSPSTGKHQHKVRSLLSDLGIKPDITMPLPRGIRHDQSLAEMILESEEMLCDKFLEDMIKRQENYQKAKARKLKTKLVEHLEINCAFRDYEIRSLRDFLNYNKVAVHQVVEAETLERDVENAIQGFQRDGFGSIVFYVKES